VDLQQQAARPWQVSAVFLIGYGLARFVSEFFRNPDAGIFGHSYTISMGQWLSLPMIIIGCCCWSCSANASNASYTAAGSLLSAAIAVSRKPVIDWLFRLLTA
jgi:prolipoprotein diacylglyceryltransferase